MLFANCLKPETIELNLPFSLLLADNCKNIGLFEGSLSSSSRPSVKSTIKINMSMKRWRNNTAKGNQKYSEKTQGHRHCIHHKSHVVAEIRT